MILVAETDGDRIVTGEIVGYALARPGPTEIAPYDSELLALHVHPSRYRRGIGRQLIAAAAEQLKQRGCASMMLWTMEKNRAHGFYKRLGGQLLAAHKVSGSGAAAVAYGWPTMERLIRNRTPGGSDSQRAN